MPPQLAGSGGSQSSGSMPFISTSLHWPGHGTQLVPFGSNAHSVEPQSVFTQRLHGSSPVLSTPSRPGSVMFMSLQFGETAGFCTMSRQPVASHVVQQPKQSQPGGVTAPQLSLHFCGTATLPH